jgi:hypothetical protein
MLLAALAATFIYTLVGAIPGADETATLAPVTLVLILAGLEPIVVLCFFMAAMIACKLIDAVPVSVAGIPAGVMSTPLVEHALILKSHGLADLSIRKIASGALVGTIVSIPVSLLLAGAIAPFAESLKAYGSVVFFVGGIILALMSKHKFLSLAVFLPMGMLIQALRYLYWGIGAVPEGKTVFISFFLGITIGPAILSLFELLNKEKRKALMIYDKEVITLARDSKIKEGINPFKILSKKETLYASLVSLIGSLAFMLSPVGLTVFLGELASSREKDPIKKASLAVSSMEALAQSTYISGTLIPLIALGIPLSPMAIGPANPLFNAPPLLTLDHNLHHILSTSEIVLATLIGGFIACTLTFYIAVKYAKEISRFVFKRIPHEAIIGLFISLVILLAYMDGGWINVAGVMVLGMFSGLVYRMGVNYGVLFMALYSAPWLIGQFAL